MTAREAALRRMVVGLGPSEAALSGEIMKGRMHPEQGYRGTGRARAAPCLAGRLATYVTPAGGVDARVEDERTDGRAERRQMPCLFGAVARSSRPFGSTVYAGGLNERTESQSFINARQTWSASGTHSKYVVQVEGRVVAEIIEHEVGYTAVRRGEGTGVWSDRGGPLSTSALDQAGLFVPGAWTIAYLHADRVGSTGWVSMGARMYVPWLARFASPDPLISGPGTQERARYSYANNNPLRWRDTTGLDDESPDEEAIVHIQTILGEWEDEVIEVVQPKQPPKPPPPPPPGDSDAHDRALPYRAPGLSEVTLHAMAHNRAVLNAEARAESERASWKDKVITAATVVGTAGAFIPVVGDAVSLISSVAVFAVEPSAENALGVVGDAAGLLIPGVPGLGSVKRAAKLAAHANDASHIAGGVRRTERVAEAAKDVERLKDLSKAGCFAAGTLVVTSEGSVPIETIKPGTLVRSRNDRTGELEWRAVTAHHVRPGIATLAVEIVDERDGRWILTTTAEHPIFVEGRGYVRADQLKRGDPVVTQSGAKARIGSVTATGETTTVYNITVDTTENYFVGSSPILVHNMKGGGCGIGSSATGGAAPRINAQKQAGHVAGTPQHAVRTAGGKTTSTFVSQAQGEAVTQEAWKTGSPLGTTGALKLKEFGQPVGVGPGGGGYQTQVRVSRDARGLIHGSPWGPVYEGPLLP